MNYKMMMTIILSVVFTSCTHFIPHYANETSTEYYIRIQNLCEGKIVEINLVNEEKYFGTNLIINNESIIFLDTTLGKYQEVDVKDVVTVSFEEQGRGVYEGMLFGALTGASLGLATQIFPNTGVGHPQGDLKLIIYTSFAGAIIGSIYGLLNQSKTIIRLRGHY